MGKQTNNPNKFDVSWYLKQYPDVAMSGMNPHEYYLNFGKTEGHRPVPDALLLRIVRQSLLVIYILSYYLIQSVIVVVRFFVNRLRFMQNMHSGSNSKSEYAINFLLKLHPQYEVGVASVAARFRQCRLPVVLHVLHSQGGGTKKHVEELCDRFHGTAKLLIMTPHLAESGKPELHIHSADPADSLDIRLPYSSFEFLVSLIESFGVSLIHIHHVLGFPFELQKLIKNLGTPFYLTVHDYMLICTNFNLMQTGEVYCGEPEPKECNRCIIMNNPTGHADINLWRSSHTWLFNDAAIVICPSQDVARRCSRYFPKATYRVVSHETVTVDFATIRVPPLAAKESLRIAVLGILARNKGYSLVGNALIIAAKNKSPLEVRLIGYAVESMPVVPDKLFTQTGEYDDAMLASLIEDFNPHLILFPNRWPETYSYTLTAALLSKRPIMVPNIGAFPERVASRPWTWEIAWDISAAQLVDKLLEIRDKNFSTATPPAHVGKNGETSEFNAIQNNGFYEDNYLSLNKNITPLIHA